MAPFDLLLAAAVAAPGAVPAAKNPYGLFEALKAGELVRGYLIARWAKASLPKIVPSMIVERVFDGVWLVAGIALAAFFVPLPRDLVEAGDLLGIVLVVAIGIFFYIIVRRRGVSMQDAELVLAEPGASRWRICRYSD